MEKRENNFNKFNDKKRSGGGYHEKTDKSSKSNSNFRANKTEFKFDSRSGPALSSKKKFERAEHEVGRGGIKFAKRGNSPSTSGANLKSDSKNFRSDEELRSTRMNEKISMKPSLLLTPVPAVFVSVCSEGGANNILTIAWTGVICSNPPMVSISVRPTRHSYNMLIETGEFVINIPTSNQVRQLDYCGVVSGSEVDKFSACKFTLAKGRKVKAPLIAECPVNLECKILKRDELGSHTMFLAEIVDVHVSKALISEKGRLALEKAKLICYVHGHYYAVGKRLNKFGFSVEKKRTHKKRIAKIKSNGNKNDSAR